MKTGRKRLQRLLAGTAVACALLLCTTLSVQAAPPPVESFTKRPAIDNVVMSPTGQRMAFLMATDAGRRVVGVMNLAPQSALRVVAAFADANVARVQWVNENRLVFEAFEDGAEITEDGAGTFAVDHEGGNLRQLIAWRNVNSSIGTRIADRTLTYGWFLHATLDDGSDDVLVYRRILDAAGDLTEGAVLARLDTVKGALTSLSAGMPGGSSNWLLDESREPRVLKVVRDGREKIYWREPGSTTWTLIEDFEFLRDTSFEPRYLERDGQLIVESRNGRDTGALYTYDLKARKLNPEPLLALEQFDVAATLEVDTKTRRLVGVHTRVDRPISVWFDARLAGIQESVDATLPPGRYNRLFCGRCESTQFFVIRSNSDRQPGEYFLYEHGKGALKRIGAARPWIDEASQGRRTFHRVAARDGLAIPVYVTHPPDSSPTEPRPAVMLVHGGPYVRGSDLSWSDEAQFLASRGYRVIEPEFRGSDGYGYAHFTAGWKAWGTAMQDDLADVAQWAAKERLVDASRLCIIGSSYGGYAALMAPIRHPAMFRCAASFAGVTDIDLMYSSANSDVTARQRRYEMPVLIGDREKDATLLRAASPLLRVGELKLPVLLAHGGLDRRVPLEHATKFVSAARKAGVSIERVDYPREGHGFYYPDNQTDFFKRLEQFLARWMASEPSGPGAR